MERSPSGNEDPNALDNRSSRELRTGKEPMQYNPANPLIVQGDRTILLEVDNPLHAEARDAIAPFAELEKSPEHIHTYRLTPLSLWNAAAAGMSAEAMVAALEKYSKFPIPSEPAGRPSRDWSAATAGCGCERDRRAAPLEHRAIGRCSKSWPASAASRDYLGERIDDDQLRDRRRPSRRAQAGPDRRRLSGRGPGRLHRRARRCRSTCDTEMQSGLPFRVRDYQKGAVDAFYAGGDVAGRLGRDRPALRRRQDDRRPGGHGRAPDARP